MPGPFCSLTNAILWFKYVSLPVHSCSVFIDGRPFPSLIKGVSRAIGKLINSLISFSALVSELSTCKASYNFIPALYSALITPHPSPISRAAIAFFQPGRPGPDFDQTPILLPHVLTLTCMYSRNLS